MQKVILVIALLALAGFATAASTEEFKLLWSAWKNTHQKTYSAFEEPIRYEIFLDNYDKVIKNNAEDKGYKFALNLFADLSAEEFKEMYTGSGKVETDEDLIRENTIVFDEDTILGDVDWRQAGIVTPVKNQGQCGSCWTFSATGVLESFHAKLTGQLLSLSEQQIVDCASGAGYGCGGGWPYLALQYAAQVGLEQEANYPYVAVNQQCQFQPGFATKVNNGYNFVAARDPNQLKGALNSWPISVLIEADQSVFQLYSSGVLNAGSGCGATLDHAVLAVGYGAEAGEDSFYVKNSWGEGWGAGGYVYISTDGSANGGAGVCGILSQPVTPA